MDPGALVNTRLSWKSRYLKPPIMRFFDMLGEPFIYYRIYPYLSRQARNRYADFAGRLLFHTVSLETRTLCNGHCAFCPASVGNDTRPDQSMPMEVFDKVMSDLAAMNYTGRIAFFVNNEPLLDKRLPQMVAQARKQVPGAYLQVLTNGIKLTSNLGITLLENGLDELQITHYTQDGRLSDRLVEAVRGLPEQYAPRVRMNLRKVDEKLYNRGGSAPNAPRLNRPIPAFCSFPFVQLNVVHDGTASLCCQDFHVASPMGNVMDDGVPGVWFGEKFTKARKDLLAMDRSQNKVCAVCDYRGFKYLSGPLKFFSPLFTVVK